MKLTLTDQMAEQNGEFTLIPEGFYAFTVKEKGDVSMSSNQNEFLPITLTIADTEQKDKLFLSEKSLWRLAQFLKSLKGGADLGALEFDPSKCSWIVGKSGQCEIVHESYTSTKPEHKGKVFTNAKIKAYVWGKDVSDPPNPEAPGDDDNDPPF